MDKHSSLEAIFSFHRNSPGKHTLNVSMHIQYRVTTLVHLSDYHMYFLSLQTLYLIFLQIITSVNLTISVHHFSGLFGFRDNRWRKLSTI